MTGARSQRKPPACSGSTPVADTRGPVRAAADGRAAAWRRLDDWFARRGWKAFAFQRSTWAAMARGESGLLHAGTGTGKTLAAWFGALRHVLGLRAAPGRRDPLTVLWITPMRALAADTQRALAEPLPALGIDWSVGLRTGDTRSAERQRQARRLPQALVTTPESLSLMLARSSARDDLAGVRVVIVDEWHELVGNKRGVQVQLALARLRRLQPSLIVWGLSATLGNLDHALDVLVPPAASASLPARRMVRGSTTRALSIETLLPATTERFPWGGHLGMRMRDAVVQRIDQAASTLLFTNTRAQAELWYQALLDARPDWAGSLALHHGSLDREVRDWVEQGLRDGRLKAVVCTSSLDLGVDFSPVEQVLQVGSAKGVARLLQRAGRSGHAPGRVSRITLVPTNAFELIEAAAARDAVLAGSIEPRRAPDRPMDVLVQHLVTVALGSGFDAADLYEEVRGCHSYRELGADEFAWALDFVTRGGPSLRVYPEYRRVVCDARGVHRVPDAGIARRHRMAIGTIVSDASISVQYLGGGRIGTVEEAFAGRLRRGDCFLFAGRLLELVRVHEMTAYVRRATGRRAAVPRWNGGRMPLSSELADAVLRRLAQARAGRFDGAEMACARPLLELQRRWSALPEPGVLLAERLRSREGHHLFLYPFAGRHVHLGLGSLLAWRIARATPATLSICVNDYGLELLSPEPVDWGGLGHGGLLSTQGLADDVLASLNSGELAQRRFREIARVSGLVFPGMPGAARSTRQLQASASLFYEVFRKHDADNRLLTQAEREVLEQELDLVRLHAALVRMQRARLHLVDLERPTPFAFPLLIERLRERLSTEKLSDRIERMLRDLEAAAGP